jgi:hypothetical protein
MLNPRNHEAITQIRCFGYDKGHTFTGETFVGILA